MYIKRITLDNFHLQDPWTIIQSSVMPTIDIINRINNIAKLDAYKIYGLIV
jgi:hypothetical protein